MDSKIRVQLEGLYGPAQGQRVIISPDAPLIVGRASGVGLCIPDDPTISRQHFQIALSGSDCRLKSLSSNGTWVNKTEVNEIELFDGDEIRIGADSIFQVRMLNEFVADYLPTVPQTSPPRSFSEQPTYCAQTCPSGLMRFTSGNAATSILDIADKLASQGPLYAIVDFRRLGQQPPETLTPEAVLFDWLPPEVALANSPLFMPAASPEFAPLWEAGWGKDGIVILLSQLEPAEMYAHLKSALKLNAQGKPTTGTAGFMGICWPGILDSLLSNGSAGLIDGILQGVDAVLIEAPDSPAGWQILAPSTFTETLKELGLEPDAATMAGLKGRKVKK